MMNEFICVFCGEDQNLNGNNLTYESKQKIALQHMMSCEAHPYSKLKKSTFGRYQTEAEKTAVYRKKIEDLLRPLQMLVKDATDEGYNYGDCKRALIKVQSLLEIFYSTLGLCGESGEIANKVKKLLRDSDDVAKIIVSLPKEIGDALWYTSDLASVIQYPLDSIAQENLDKLQDRKDRDQIHGSGDNR
jgi:NTP pyrophosphatase (non-canonical NTP hydrolase)